jgi:hypothetical protein
LLLIFSILLTIPASSQVSNKKFRYDWPLFVYNFGGLDKNIQSRNKSIC